MTTDFFGYELDDDPVCPMCRQEEIGIYENGYYCLNCHYPFQPFARYSKGVPELSLPETTARTTRVIDCGEYEVVQDWMPRPNNVVDIRAFKKKRQSRETFVYEGPLPNDYEECLECGFDHGYDYACAKRWHEAHPEFPMITQDDLIEDK